MAEYTSMGTSSSLPGGVWSGVVKMTEGRYRMLATLAGSDLLVARPYAVSIGELSAGEQKAIYAAVNLSGYVCYVGQTQPSSRSDHVASGRINQHLTSESKREEWAAYWVIPLQESTSAAKVFRLEREVCARLGLPVRNRRWKARERAFYASS